jgi:hypothetical protein
LLCLKFAHNSRSRPRGCEEPRCSTTPVADAFVLRTKSACCDSDFGLT